MRAKRFKELGKGSFWGELVYQRAVPAGHFLRQLESVIDGEVFSARLIELYVGQGKLGRPPYDPVLLLKMLLLTYLYDLSERQVEAWVNDGLAAKCFLGLAADEPAPDHSTLSAFRGRLVERGQEACLEELLQEIIRQVRARGVGFGSIQVVDSTVIEADVNVAKVALGHPLESLAHGEAGWEQGDVAGAAGDAAVSDGAGGALQD